MQKYIIDFLAGLLVATLSGMGVGGGGLLVIYLTLVKDTKQLSAQGLNLVFFICAGIASMGYHIFHRKMRIKVILLCASTGIVGTIGGCFLASFTGELLRPIFGGFLIFCGALSLIKGVMGKKGKRAA